MRSFRKVLTSTVATALVLSACGVAIPANAAPMVDQTQTITDIGSTSAMCLDMIGIYTLGIGSTFTAGVSGLLTSIEFPISYANSNRGASVNIWSVDDISGLPTGSPIASQAVSLATLSSLQNGGNLNVVFDTPITIVAAGKYAFTIDLAADCTGGMNQVGFRMGLSDPDKRTVYREYSDATVDPAYGISFTTFVENQSPPASAPDASLAATGAEVSWILLGSLSAIVTGAGFLALGRRQRRV